MREPYFNGTGKFGRKPNSVDDAKSSPYKKLNVTPYLYPVRDYQIRFFCRLQTNLNAWTHCLSCDFPDPDSEEFPQSKKDIMNIESYINDRVDDQIKYFDRSAVKNQRIYRFSRMTAISCNVLTALAIALTFAVPVQYKVEVGLAALVLTMIVLATYQIEEFFNFGAKWQKFRIVSELIKSEKYMYLNGAGVYTSADLEQRKRIFVKRVEDIFRSTDMSYFALTVEPTKGLERRSS